MRIISKFKDYYDSGLGLVQGIDPVVYVRSTEEIVDKDLLKKLDVVRQKGLGLNDVWSKDKTVYRTFKGFVVLFCGKTYRGIRVQTSAISVPMPKDKTDCFYSYDSFVNFLASKKIDTQEVFGSNRRGFAWFRNPVDERIRNFLDKQGSTELESELVRNRITAAVNVFEYESTWIKDPSLASVEFFKVMPTFIAYQEIDMYRTGVLTQQDAELINISDKDRVYQHGFDEYSFRKLPGEPKRNRVQA